MKYIILLAVLSLSSCAPALAQCPDIGSATNVRLQNLNVMKNRPIVTGTIDTNVTLAKILAPGEDTGRFNDSQYVCITGYVLLAKWGGGESCNCKTIDKAQWDIHIVLVKDSSITSQDSGMICEITRKYQAIYPSLSPGQFKNHTIQVCGYLFRDDEHIHNSVNDDLNKSDFRKSPFEVHPIVSIKTIR